jgi:ubiquinone/menaquinone biosynthesis C-methylase UbiE
MHQALFATIHERRGWLAMVAIKAALVLAAFSLLGGAATFFALGMPILLLHAGALAVIAAHRSVATKARPPASDEPKTPHVGILLHSAALYDLLAWVLTFGRERTFRERMLSFARLKPGEAVLDIGCGTGTIALLAKRQVGLEGRVDGIDASPEMVARATVKARRAGLQLNILNATAQHLPYENGAFDVVLSTLMFHHLPKAGRAEFAREAFRVLKPGGRVVIVDFAKPPRQKRAFRLHRHGHTDLDKVAGEIGQSGFTVVEQGDVGTQRLRYLIARRDSGHPRQPE